MNIYPAIDLKSGKCVRLYQGSYEHVTEYEEDPIRQANNFVTQGASFLHIVDLDGAKAGEPVNLELILNIKNVTKAQIQMGGGIRQKTHARSILKKGIDRIIIGSLAIANPSEIKAWIKDFGPDQIVLALDIRLDDQNIPKLASHGWQKESEKNLWSLMAEYQDSGLRHVLCTDIGRDGTLSGPNFELYTDCVKRFPEILFQASGGISNLENLQQLSKIPVDGAVVGKAIYENKFSVIEAMKIC